MRIAIVGGGPGGLYFALLMKKAHPGYEISVHEQNRADDTFGFGVVFSDETLGNFLSHDPDSYRSITDAFAYWDEIDFVWHGETIRTTGHGFCGCGRRELLLILQQRCRDLGVTLSFESRISDLSAFGDADLIVAADGVNSVVRETYKDHFRPSFEWRRNKFVWLGSTKPLDAFTFDFTENEHGPWVLGAYQYNSDFSTWVVEAPEDTWKNAEPEIADLNEADLISYMEALWSDRLDGHRLIGNKSLWRTFPTIRNENWHHGNIVLLGDALHTAHYSIGSGTKLAMEDAIALFEAVTSSKDVPQALEAFETARRTEVEITQHAADVSVVWTENVKRYWHMEPLQATYSMLTRSKQITHENLRLRDPQFIDAVEADFADRACAETPPGTPPMFTPLRLRDMQLANRVMVSPMDMYSASDGAIGDFHFVHFGSLALGGAGLIFSEMACVSESARITPGCAGIYTHEHVAAWRRVIEFVHANSQARFCLQIGHAGRKGSTCVAWEGMDEPLPHDNWPLMAPSALAYNVQNQVPHEMTRHDMDAVKADFVRAAELAIGTGADMIELHMAHGYLLSSFITPVSNRRDDEYGGSLENRLRFPLEVFDAVRATWPREKPMSVRISATDWVGEAGLAGDDAVIVAKMLKDHGCDIIDVSTGQTTPDAEPVYGRMFQTWFSEKVRNEAGIPTIAVGNITTWDQVNTILAAGRADIVALARPHLTNPHFTLQAAAYYNHECQHWPKQYQSGKEQAYRLSAREREEEMELKKSARQRTAVGT